MELKQIEFFLKLYEELNFTKASNALFISQQGLSKSINNLEKELGIPLFTRNTKEMKPTVHGHRLYHRFKDVASSVKNVYTEVESIKNSHNGEVHFIITKGTMYYVPMEFLIDFQKTYPDIKVIYEEAEEKEADALLKTKEWDIGILTEPVSDRDFHQCTLFSEKLKVFMHKDHPLAKEEIVRFDDLDKERLLFFPADYKIRASFDIGCAKRHIHPDIVFESPNPVYLYPLVDRNAGITLSIPSAFSGRRSDNIVSRPIDWDDSVSFCLAWKKEGYLSSSSRLFIEFVLDYYKEKMNKLLLTDEERILML